MAFDISKPGAGFYDGNTPEFKTQLTDFSLAWAPTYSGTLDISDPTEVDSSKITERGYDVLTDLTPSLEVSLPINGTQSTAIHIANVSFKVGENAQEGVYGFKFNPLAAFDGAAAGSANTTPLGTAATPRAATLAMWKRPSSSRTRRASPEVRIRVHGHWRAHPLTHTHLQALALCRSPTPTMH